MPTSSDIISLALRFNNPIHVLSTTFLGGGSVAVQAPLAAAPSPFHHSLGGTADRSDDGIGVIGVTPCKGDLCLAASAGPLRLLARLRLVGICVNRSTLIVVVFISVLLLLSIVTWCRK